MTRQTILAGACALMLAACGSSGGGDGDSHRPSGRSHLNLIGKTVELSSDHLQTFTGNAQANNIQLNRKQQGRIDQITVNGKTYRLLPEHAVTNGIFREQSGNIKRVIGNNLQYAKYGNYEVKEANGLMSMMFAQGVATPERAMPASGQAVYQGLAVYSQMDKLTGKGFYQTNAHSEVRVDFGKKELSLNVSRLAGGADITPFAFHAKIQGNRFDNLEGTKRMLGGFYGPAAEEVAGWFLDNGRRESIAGTFGAEKQ
ncbi:transferrin-binding protein-like solute binding protein [Conchiformibius kuhniae]|uniref:Transferrin-binding protein-like solute binding protein n=1 Tax=Conchiformibius kuhniae TaxID=211502 RepID=A0A8T9MRL5_9NEIS|nr:transferrin-binding protein-like solute binding protein [Conchiformibius kuhniae]